MKKWEIRYQGHTIRVEDGVRKERLFVDGELQDEFFGSGIRSRLFGTIRDGNGGGKPIRVSLGGWNRTCRVFVDDRLVFHSKPDRVASLAMAQTRNKLE